MIRTLAICVAVLAAIWTSAALADDRAALLDFNVSTVEHDWRGQTEIRLALSRGVPYRVFTLDAPPRLVVDFREGGGTSAGPGVALRDGTGISAMRFGPFSEGWSRLVADLTGPMLPEDIGMSVDKASGAAVLRMVLAPADAMAFRAAAGAPADSQWPESQIDVPAGPAKPDRFVIVIDPGHGGIDPGAERDGLSEKELMLDMAIALRERLLAKADLDVVLTRDEDVFVSLETRVAIAHRVQGDVFLSLHADALSQGGARGAAIYLLSEEASDKASEHLAARHNRADIIAGADLTGSDDEVTSLLLDLVRLETEPRSEALASSLIAGLTAAGGPMNRHPLRRAGFSVLKSADIPSALIEVGFLSSARDLDNLRNPVWRAGIVEAIAGALLDWKEKDQRMRLMVRK